MVSLEEDLGAKVVAEGVERTEGAAPLRELGVPLAQGSCWPGHRDPTPARWTAAMLELAEPGGFEG